MLETRSQRVSVVLHDAGAEAWHRATTHPMVRAIGEGSLPHEVFRRYFEQNILYLQDYVRAIALIVAKAPDRDAIATLSRFLMHIADNEIPANLAFLERLGGDPASIAGVESMLPPAYAYTRHLLTSCALGDCADGLTAVLPCQWSYGEIARPLMQHRPEDAIYADWIALFGDAKYDALVAATTSLLDRLADPGNEAQMMRLSGIFDRSTRYEVAFWDMAYGEPAPGEPRPDE